MKIEQIIKEINNYVERRLKEEGQQVEGYKYYGFKHFSKDFQKGNLISEYINRQINNKIMKRKDFNKTKNDFSVNKVNKDNKEMIKTLVPRFKEINDIYETVGYLMVKDLPYNPNEIKTENQLHTIVLAYVGIIEPGKYNIKTIGGMIYPGVYKSFEDSIKIISNKNYLN